MTRPTVPSVCPPVKTHQSLISEFCGFNRGRRTRTRPSSLSDMYFAAFKCLLRLILTDGAECRRRDGLAAGAARPSGS